MPNDLKIIEALADELRAKAATYRATAGRAAKRIADTLDRAAWRLETIINQEGLA